MRDNNPNEVGQNWRYSKQMIEKHASSVSRYIERNVENSMLALAVITTVIKGLLSHVHLKGGPIAKQHATQIILQEFQAGGWIVLHGPDELAKWNVQTAGVYRTEQSGRILGTTRWLEIRDPWVGRLVAGSERWLPDVKHWYHPVLHPPDVPFEDSAPPAEEPT